MSAGRILDTVERLFTSAGHPDIVSVGRYGTGDVEVTGLTWGDLRALADRLGA